MADPHEPETAETPDRDTEAVTSLPSDPAAVTDRARQAKPAKETTTQVTVDRGLGQGKPVKVAKPLVAKPASATKLASWVKPTTGQGTQPTDPSSVTTDPATTPQDPGPAADAEPTAQP